MSRGQVVAASIERSVSGPMWHGPSLMDLIGDVSADHAGEHPIDGGHSIWELVLHMTAWTEITRERLAGSAKAEPTPEEDWPPLSDRSPEAWRSAVERMKEAHRELAAEVAKLGDSDLIGRVPGKDHSVLTMIHGIVEHDAYHGGQIAILKRALEQRAP
jgi:uncharacterized damage-inducible protein DinB